MTDQNQLMREALESYEHAIANGHREHDALSAFDGISVPDLVRRVLAITNPPEPASVGGVPMSDERIDHIADLVVKGMPDGIQGFLKSWGWRQFARAILADCAGHYAAPQAPADVVRDAERYRFIRDASRSDCITPELGLYAMESLDEYVDAAMEGEAAMSTKVGKGGAV